MNIGLCRDTHAFLAGSYHDEHCISFLRADQFFFRKMLACLCKVESLRSQGFGSPVLSQVCCLPLIRTPA